MSAEEAFALSIEKIRKETGLSYLDSIVLWAARNQCEIESAAALVKKDSVLKSKLMMESQTMNMLKSKSANTLF
jgi:hypothetical protein